MEIKKKYYAKYLHDIAIDQIAENYRKNGFKVKKEVPIGDYQADLIASKRNENIVIEVKTGKLTTVRKSKLAKLADYVQSLGNYQFKVAIAKLPKEKELQVDDIENILFKHFSENFPDELDELSTHTKIEEITDIFLNKLVVADNATIVAEGSGIMSIHLQFGSRADQLANDGFVMNSNVPFDFKAELSFNDEKKLEVEEFNTLEIDTSSFDK